MIQSSLRPLIILFTFRPLTDKVIENFYIKSMLEKGFEVHNFDLEEICYPQVKFNSSFLQITNTKLKVLKIKSLEEMDSILQKFNPSQKVISIVTGDINTQTANFFTWAKKTPYFKFPLAYFSRGRTPHLSMSFLEKISLLLNPKEFMQLMGNRFYLNKQSEDENYKKPDLFFYSGLKAKEQAPTHSETISIPYFDYDKFIHQKAEIPSNTEEFRPQDLPKKYAVFLDPGIVDHHDFTILKTKTVTPEGYFKSYNRFFEMIEKNFNLSVIIAAHPYAIYTSANFNKRQLYKGRTYELVRWSELCLADWSTSISFAIIFRRPIILAYTNEMKKNMKSTAIKFIRAFAKELSLKALNIDLPSLERDLIIPQVVEEDYLTYILNYLTDDPEGRMTSESIFMNFLDNFFQKN